MTLIQALIAELPKREPNLNNYTVPHASTRAEWCKVPEGYELADVAALLILLGADKDCDGDARLPIGGRDVLTNSRLEDDEYSVNAHHVGRFLELCGVIDER